MFLLFRVLTLLGFLKHDNAQRQAKDIFLDYIKERSQQFELKKKFVSLGNTLRYIVTRITNHKLLERARMKFLHEAWQFMVDHLCETLGKEKKHKRKVEKIRLLPDTYRDEALKRYMARAKLMFRLKIYCDVTQDKEVALVKGKDPKIEAMKKDIKKLESDLGFKKEKSSNKDREPSPNKNAQAAAGGAKSGGKFGASGSAN